MKSRIARIERKLKLADSAPRWEYKTAEELGLSGFAKYLVEISGHPVSVPANRAAEIINQADPKREKLNQWIKDNWSYWINTPPDKSMSPMIHFHIWDYFKLGEVKA